MFYRALNILKKQAPYIFISPFYIIFSVFFLFPSIFGLILAFYRWHGSGTFKFMGIKNFKYAFLYDHSFWIAAKNTIIYSSVSIFIIIPLSILLAVALNSKLLYFRTFWQSAFFAPIVTNSVAIALTFNMLFNERFGAVNSILYSFGIDRVNWLGSSPTDIIVVNLLLIWRWVGMTSIYFLAALQSISKDYYEAAKLDRATSFQQLWYITLPLLNRVTLFVSIITIIGSIQIYDEPTILKGFDISTISLTQYMVKYGINNLKFGYASTVGTIIFISIVFLSFIRFYTFKETNANVQK